jgi:hypothetical protein
MSKTPKNDEFKSVNTEIVSSRPIDVLTMTLFIIVFQLVCFVHKCNESVMQKHASSDTFAQLIPYSRGITFSHFKINVGCRMGMGWRKLPPPPIPLYPANIEACRFEQEEIQDAA